MATPQTMPNRQVMLMKEARERATFDSGVLARIIYGGEEATTTRLAAFNRVERALGTTNPYLLPPAYANLDRTTTYLRGLREARAMLTDTLHHGNHAIFETASHTNSLINSSPYGIHTSLFTTTLKLQCSPQQLAHWLPLAETGQIIGCYAQTELGHGTNIRGLETTATFDPSTDEFVIHSPTLTSTKYWPGGLAFSSSHAIVMARLVVGTADHGVHAFLVQLRDLDTWRPLPGIELGDLGLKMGLNETDNGFAVFTHVRVKREEALLMGNCSLSREGVYRAPGHAKAGYATMVYGRVAIARVVSIQLAQACVIATRYSVVREQGTLEPAPNAPEAAVFGYRSQHGRLLGWMARAFALLFASKSAAALHADIVARGKRGDFGLLAYGHPVTAMLKALATTVAGEGAEDARKCAGGHGFSVLSGLPAIVETVLPTATLEGENWVLWQQGGRFLVKAAAGVRAGRAVDQGVGYLAAGFQEREAAWREGRRVRCAAQGEEWLSPEVQVAAFQHRATRLVFQAEEALRRARRAGKSEARAWNEGMMGIVYAARAHCEVFVLGSFVAWVERARAVDEAVGRVLGLLCSLYALTAIESPAAVNSMAFLEDGYLSGDQVCGVRKVVGQLLDQLVPEAVGLTDSWAFSDACLGSALGGWEGDVYERLMGWTRQVPVNCEGVGEREGRKEWERWRRVVAGAKL